MLKKLFFVMLLLVPLYSGRSQFDADTNWTRLFDNDITKVFFSPNDSLIVVLEWHNMYVLETTTGDVVKKLWYSKDAEFTPDGSRLVCGTDSGLYVYDTETWERIPFETDTISIMSVEISADGSKYYAPILRHGAPNGIPYTESDIIQVWDATTGLKTDSIGLPSDTVSKETYVFYSVDYSNDGNYIVLSMLSKKFIGGKYEYYDKRVRSVLNATTYEKLYDFKDIISTLVLFNNSSKIICRNNSREEYVIFQLTDGTPLDTLEGNEDPYYVKDYCISSDDKYFAVAGYPGEYSMQIWDLETGEKVYPDFITELLNRMSFKSFEFSHSNRYIIMSNGLRIKLYQTTLNSILEKEDEDSQIIYPNPTDSNITISNLSKDFYEVKLYDLNGKIIKDFGKVYAVNSIIELNLSDFSPNTYIVKLSNETQQKTFKVIISK